MAARQCGVDSRWCVIHATHTTEHEIRALAASGAVAGLCPLTEASLGDGIFAGRGLSRGRRRFGIGTDSNIQIDAAAELRQLEYGQRLAYRARNVMTVSEGESTGRRLLASALTGGARALQQPIGALAQGQRADIVLLDLAPPGSCVTPQRSMARRLDLLGRTAGCEVGARRRRSRRGGRTPQDATGHRGTLQASGRDDCSKLTKPAAINSTSAAAARRCRRPRASTKRSRPSWRLRPARRDSRSDRAARPE